MTETADLRRTAVSGIRWVVSARVIVQVIGLSYTVALARLLTPDDYGLFAMAIVAIHFARYVEGLRLEPALVQSKTVDEETYSSVLYVMLLSGAALAAAFVVGAPAIGFVFNEPRVVPLLRFLSLVFVLGAFGAVPRARLRRDFRYRWLGIIQILQVVPAGAVGVIMATRGYGVWSLAAYSLIQVATDSVGSIIAAKWIPSARFSLSKLRRLMRFAAPSTVNELLSYIQHNIGTVVIGRYIGTAPLGLYQVANSFLGKPAAIFQEVFRQVAFPVFSRLWDEPDRMKRAFYEAVQAVFVLALPAAAIVAVAAPELIRALFGVKWLDSIPVVRILSPLLLLVPYLSLTSNVIQALGKPGTDATFRFISVAGLLLSIPLAVTAGVEGVCVALVIWFAVCAAASQRWIKRVLKLSWIDLAGRTVFPILASAAMGLAIWLVRIYGLANVSVAGRLIVTVPLGLAIYLLLTRIFAIEAWHLIRQYVGYSSSEGP